MNDTHSIKREDLLIHGIRTPCFDGGGDAKEAIVFLHGNPGSGRDWLDLLSQVQEFSRTLAPDMPGFGTADKPVDFDYTVAGYAKHFGALLEERGIERVHLVLHDFGGPWGLAWAADNPSKVASLSLINIGIMRGYRWHYLAVTWRLPVIGEIFQATTTRWAFHIVLKHGNPRGLPKPFIDGMYANFDRGTRRAILKLYRATNDLGGAADAAQAALKPLDLDCLVIWGKRDPYVPWRFAAQQRETFPRAEIIYLEDSGHWPFIDNPQAVTDALIPFLKNATGNG